MRFYLEKVSPIIVLMMIMGMLGESVGAVHKVGGSAGWTILGNVNYQKWTSSDTFTAGDSLLFVYNSQYHNVKQVSRRDFLSCNATSAVAIYTSGSDTVALTKPGHYYFLCGFPGHCQAGQKLHVLVDAAVDSPSISPALSPSTGLSPSPSPARAFKETAQNGAVTFSVSTTLASAMSSVVVFLVTFVFY